MGKPAVRTEFESLVWILALGCCLYNSHKFEESTGEVTLALGLHLCVGKASDTFAGSSVRCPLTLLIGTADESVPSCVG